MIVKIVNYGGDDEKFIEYDVLGLTLDQMEFLNGNLEEETTVDGDAFRIKMYFSDELYPFQSDVAKYRLDDFIAREEIEMTFFISGVLEDM